MSPLYKQDTGNSPGSGKYLGWVSATCKVKSIDPRALNKIQYTRPGKIIPFVQMWLISPQWLR